MTVFSSGEKQAKQVPVQIDITYPGREFGNLY